MRKLDLDYASARPHSGWSLPLLAGGMALAAAALLHFQAVQRESAALAAASSGARDQPGQRDRAPARQRADAARQAEEVAAANAVIRELSLPWEDLFSTFELAASSEIALLAIEPDARKRVVKVTAESRTAQGMLNYIKRLQRAPLLDEVVLQKHELQIDVPGKPLRFVVVGAWKDPK